MKVRIDGMMCMKCAGRVQKALEALGGEAQVDLENKCATVADTLSEAAVKEAVEKAGYTFVGVVKD